MKTPSSLSSCFYRFCRTKNVLMIPLVVCSYLIALQHSFPLSLIGTLLGLSAYIALERYFHAQMHENEKSPFYTLHRIHHRAPSPENGCPEYWTFAFYFFVTLSIYLLHRPIIAGGWFGITYMLFWYEWIHFLCHCNYKPKTKYGWRIRRNHLRHHYVDSNTDHEMLVLKQ